MKKFNRYIFYDYCKHEDAIMTMCKKVVIKIVIALKIVDGS